MGRCFVLVLCAALALLVIDLFMAYGVTTTSIVQSSPVPRRPVDTHLGR